MMKPTKLYVCGPMTGYPKNNFPAFQETTARLRGLGYEVHCPTEISVVCGCEPGAHTWEEYLRRDIAAILEVDALAVLQGFTNSRGAMLEIFVAYKLGIKICPADTFREDMSEQNFSADYLLGLFREAHRKGVL